MTGRALKTSVIYATADRPSIVAQAVRELGRQTQPPHAVILSCVRAADAGEAAGTLVLGEPGLTKQRNAALRTVPSDTDLVAFFDDDFVADPHWIEVAAAAFAAYPDIAAVTGALVADGIKGPGLTFADAARLLAESGAPAQDIEEGYLPYGCNMIFRRAALEGLRFDERLVLYGWQEDRDFGQRVAQRGRAVRIGGARGVHLGVKAGRVSGLRLGYSQIANPLYLWAKGTMHSAAVADHLARNVSSNLARAIAPEPHVDRLGRLRGNALALIDLVRGKMAPERILTL